MRINKKTIIYFLAVFIGVIFFLFIISCSLIGQSVKEKCTLAQNKYEGDCVEALIQVVDSDANNFKERNDAIWALGQLGDSRAQEVLAKYYTGQIPEREPYNEALSQYEMKKALKLVKGGANITHLFWNEKSL